MFALPGDGSGKVVMPVPVVPALHNAVKQFSTSTQLHHLQATYIFSYMHCRSLSSHCRLGNTPQALLVIRQVLNSCFRICCAQWLSKPVRPEQWDKVSWVYQVDMVPVLVSSFEQGHIGVPSQVMHDLHFTPHVLYILY